MTGGGRIKSSEGLSREPLRLSVFSVFFCHYDEAVAKDCDVPNGVDDDFREISEFVGVIAPVRKWEIPGFI